MKGLQMDQNAATWETGVVDGGKVYDDDGREARTGTWLTASAHIITAVIGVGVLSLAWAVSQLGWVAGTLIMVIFSIITYFTSMILADCYRYPDPVTGKRNYNYMDAVRSYLGGMNVTLCGAAQYGNLVGIVIGFTITASISLVAVNRSNCYHFKGRDADCTPSNYPYMAAFGCIQIVLSQIPNFHKLSILSILAAVMSFTYATIGVGLAIATIVDSNPRPKTTLTGATVGVDISATEKVFKTFQGIGNIAFSYAYANVLIEIQDTLRSSPPENKAMKRATTVGVSITTMFYVLCGTLGYAAFGSKAPGDLLTDFGFFEPFWLVDFANICIAVHLIGAYQIFAQPIYQIVESNCSMRWPNNKFINNEYTINVPFYGNYYVNFFKLVSRTAYVSIVTVIAMIFPFFNAILGLLGAASFWPLSIYFPIQMHIAQAKIKKYSLRWIWLKILIWVCLFVSLVSAIGSIEGLIQNVRTYKPFRPVHQ